MTHWKRILTICFAAALCLTLFTGCGNGKSAVSADLSYTRSDIGTLSVPTNVQIVGLGEASHGVAQYHQMKADVFKALVENNGCHTFIIEGDFGGALKVDQYINGGTGTAEEAVAEIGFAIYRTREMADLVEWMHSYNESASSEQALRFYGMDVQRFDNNKEYLFSVLDQTHPELSAEYAESLVRLTDKNRNSLDETTLNSAKESVSALIDKLDAVETDIADRLGQPTFDFARECAKTIYAYCDVLLSDNYNTTRDQYMYEKVEWFLQHGDNTVLFINGHNGHIGKTSVAGYPCLGKLLTDDLGDNYYAIGTDARNTRFNSQTDDGGFEVMEVSNANDLNRQFSGEDSGRYYFIDFASASSDEVWGQILSEKQSITTLNVSLSGMEKLLKAAYTVNITPRDTFDGMIIFDSVSPSTILSKEG